MKIIVLTSKFGMGHYSAAKTLTERLPASCSASSDLFS